MRRSPGGEDRRRGQSVVEFALLVPVLMFMLLIAVDFGRLFFSYIQLQNAVREAAAYGAGQPTRTDVMTARANQERNSQGQAGEGAFTLTTECRNQSGTVIACSAAPGGSGPGNTITVILQSPFNFMTPLINGFFGGSGLTMTASSTTAVLGSAASGGHVRGHVRRPDRDRRPERLPARHAAVRHLGLQLGLRLDEHRRR